MMASTKVTPLPSPPPQGGRGEFAAPLSQVRNGCEPFGVYVHWPFCRAKCPYCDFNSHVRHGGIDEARFLAAYLRELAHLASLAPGRSASQATAPPASTGCRSGCRRSTIRASKLSGGSTRRQTHWQRSRSPSAISAASPSI